MKTQEALKMARVVALNSAKEFARRKDQWLIMRECQLLIDFIDEALESQEAQEVKEVMDLASYGQSISRIPAQPLSDDEIYRICQNIKTGVEGQILVARAIEKAHGIGVKDAASY